MTTATPLGSYSAMARLSITSPHPHPHPHPLNAYPHHGRVPRDAAFSAYDDDDDERQGQGVFLPSIRHDGEYTSVGRTDGNAHPQHPQQPHHQQHQQQHYTTTTSRHAELNREDSQPQPQPPRLTGSKDRIMSIFSSSGRTHNAHTQAHAQAQEEDDAVGGLLLPPLRTYESGSRSQAQGQAGSSAGPSRRARQHSYSVSSLASSPYSSTTTNVNTNTNANAKDTLLPSEGGRNTLSSTSASASAFTSTNTSSSSLLLPSPGGLRDLRPSFTWDAPTALTMGTSSLSDRDRERDRERMQGRGDGRWESTVSLPVLPGPASGPLESRFGFFLPGRWGDGHGHGNGHQGSGSQSNSQSQSQSQGTNDQLARSVSGETSLTRFTSSTSISTPNSNPNPPNPAKRGSNIERLFRAATTRKKRSSSDVTRPTEHGHAGGHAGVYAGVYAGARDGEGEEGERDELDELGGAAGGGPGGRGDMDPTAVRRLAHLQCEQRRRESINGGFATLRNILPETTAADSKAAILQKAINYIQNLEQAVRVSGGRLEAGMTASPRHSGNTIIPTSTATTTTTTGRVNPTRRKRTSTLSNSYSELAVEASPPLSGLSGLYTASTSASASLGNGAYGHGNEAGTARSSLTDLVREEDFDMGDAAREDMVMMNMSEDEDPVRPNLAGGGGMKVEQEEHRDVLDAHHHHQNHPNHPNQSRYVQEERYRPSSTPIAHLPSKKAGFSPLDLLVGVAEQARRVTGAGNGSNKTHPDSAFGHAGKVEDKTKGAAGASWTHIEVGDGH